MQMSRIAFHVISAHAHIYGVIYSILIGQSVARYKNRASRTTRLARSRSPIIKLRMIIFASILSGL